MVTYIFYILPFFISLLSLLLVVWYIPCIEQEPHKWGCSPSLPEYKRQSDCSPMFIYIYIYVCIHISIFIPKNEYIFVCKRALQCTHPNVETAGVDIEGLVVRFKAIFTRAQCRRCWGKTLFVEESCIIWLPSLGSRKVTKQDKVNYAVYEREYRVTNLTTRLTGCSRMYWAATGLQMGCTKL